MIISRLKYRKKQKDWRKKNSHNFTTFGRIQGNPDCITVGNYTYGAINVSNMTDNSKLKIGHFCSIAGNVQFLLAADHQMNTMSTYPFKRMLLNGAPEALSKGDIIVGDDVWIGENAIILSGVNVGQGSVIAAGAVVTKDVPPYSIVGGNPASVLKYRFDESIISELVNIDYSILDYRFVENNIEKLYKKISRSSDIGWMPKK